MIQRTEWQDNAKGLGIILVVFGHAIRGLMASHLVAGSLWLSFDFALYTFHMPLFMFLAGLNVQRSLEKGRGRFVRSKIIQVAYPYFVWSIIQGLVMLALGGVLNGTPSHEALLSILWRPISPFWFLYVLFVFLILTALMGQRAFIVLAVIALPLAEFLGKDTLVHQLLHFALFFALGIAAAHGGALSIKRGIAFAGLAVAVAIISAALWQHFSNYNSVLIAPAAICMSGFIIWISQQFSEGWLGKLGRLSMPIYVMHILAVAGTRILMSKVLHIPDIEAVYVVTDVAAGILLPVLAYYALRHIGALPLLGLSTDARGHRWIKGHLAPSKGTYSDPS